MERNKWSMKRNKSAVSLVKRERMTRKTARTIIITIILTIYSILTIIPFYFLIINSFVPTIRATELHLFIPELQRFNMDYTYGNASTYMNLDTEKFKTAMGIEGYISPGTTFKKIAEKYKISEEKIIKYMDPFTKFNGWMVILTDRRFVNSVSMTVIVALTSVLLGGLLSLATGSVLARFKKRWHQWVYNTYMLSMVIPTIMILLPLYIIITKVLNIGDTYLSLILLNIKGGALSCMLFTGFISLIPHEMKESLDMDGGNRFHYFFKILLPLCKIPFASLLAIELPWFWNEFLLPLVLLSQKKYTLIPMISSLQSQFTTNYQAIYAGLAISIIPLLTLYFVFQKLFVRSVFAGALKG